MQIKSPQIEISQTHTQPDTPRFFRLTSSYLKILWHSTIFRAKSKRKMLTVRETAALGDRRFVSVIQFERQRFLIGSSSSSITLLAQLPEESARSSQNGDQN
jgi:flagellar biogenesis protein FliO